ncbi:MAG TPA: hypothetical protein VLA25_04835, partial [Methylotenera sp.]|nr:hypothetical protein [Methylotenera sp.]
IYAETTPQPVHNTLTYNRDSSSQASNYSGQDSSKYTAVLIYLYRISSYPSVKAFLLTHK